MDKNKWEEARRAENPQSHIEEGVAEKRPRNARGDSEINTEAGGEVDTFRSQSRHKKGHMMNFYLTDSDKKAIVDFVKDYEELYCKTNEHFMAKARKECLWERSASSRNLSVKVCKTHYRKLTQLKSGQAPNEMAKRQNWIQDKFNFLKTHIRRKRLNNLQPSFPWP